MILLPSQYFIGIAPPHDTLTKVERFQQKWLDFLGVEPHVTLKAQGGLTSDKKWIESIETVCQNTQPFLLTLDKPAYFGDNILYLSVVSEQLYSLHEAIVKAVSPSEELIKQYFELEDFVPHLTLGKEQYGLSKIQLQEMERSAQKELAPYPTFKVDRIRVYELTSDSERYEPFLELSLGR